MTGLTTWRLRWLSRSSLAGIAKEAGVLLVALALALAFAPRTSSWGTSVHRDQATTLYGALIESPSIPAEVKARLDSGTIYMASTAPDEWIDATGIRGTYQYNMAENAYYEFQRIRDAWAAGDYDNAVYRIGIVLHYVGDVIDLVHNENIRQYYRRYIPPLGSDSLLWGAHRDHWGRQQAEAYADSDSVWYPRRPENYGPADDGSLDWFLSYFYSINIDSDDPPSDFGTIIGRYIRASSPAVEFSPYDNEDNLWFYWLSSRDPELPKMAVDNTMRLVYNGVYRALRDGEWGRQGNPGTPPADWDYWPWPTTTEWLAPRTYGEGMDTVRYYQGLATGR